MYAFSPKQIEAYLYKTKPQRLKDWLSKDTHKLEIVYALLMIVLIAYIFSHMISYSHKVDQAVKIYNAPIESQRLTPEIGSGAWVQNPITQ